MTTFWWKGKQYGPGQPWPDDLKRAAAPHLAAGQQANPVAAPLPEPPLDPEQVNQAIAQLAEPTPEAAAALEALGVEVKSQPEPEPPVEQKPLGIAEKAAKAKK